MFDHDDSMVGLLAGEADYASGWCDDDDDPSVHLLVVDDLASGWVSPVRHVLPDDLEQIPVGPFLGVILGSVDRSRLNGFDLVRSLKARERLVAHHQAGSMADAVEVSYAAPGDASSDPGRLEEAFEFASDEIRAGLTLTRRAAENRLGLASDLVERLPRVWQMFYEGQLDLARCRVIVNGTAHLGVEEAGGIVEMVAERAPRLTTGELGAWIRRLCVDSDPEESKQRYETAVEARRLWIEQTVDGTGSLHLLDIDIADAKAIGRRINGHLFNIRTKTDPRSHDQLRADITTDMLLGADPTNRGRGLVDIRVDLATLAGLDDKSAELPGIGPVIADVARQVADRQQKAEWRVVVSDVDGEVIDIVTTRRRPTKTLSRYMETIQPVCAYPGCRQPARNCDYDHLRSWSDGGETSSDNGGLKCRHDHGLKDHDWKHQRINGQDHWTSPLGHTYTKQKPP